MSDKPSRCIDAVLKSCQYCEFGVVEYPEWVENSHDLEGCNFETHCMYGLENTQPTEEELEEFERWVNRS